MYVSHASTWYCAYPKRANSATVSRGRVFVRWYGGLCYVANEGGFEAKALEEGRTGVGPRRNVVVIGGRRIRGNHRAGNGHAVEGHNTTSRGFSRRRGNG